MQDKKFRNDINGLRAIAVLAVMLFHFIPSSLPGGFAGVDVFFAISGFLMTGIIFRGIESGDFKILQFYKSRATRIVPPLFFLCIILFCFGWFYFLPSDYEYLGKELYKSITFTSNQFYSKSDGYFDSGAYEKWLLHTWSLSIEWQFYIIYPLLIIVLSKIFNISNIKKIIITLSIILFLVNIFYSEKHTNSAYFSLLTRSWEMGFGGIAYFFTLKKWNRTLCNIGIILIIVSFYFYSKNNLWPSYGALLPVTGAFLILISNYRLSILSKSIFFQKIGRWSYSIYLYHWPIAVYLYASPFDSVISSIIGILLSILLGFLSYKYIESGHVNSLIKKRGLISPILMIIAIYCLGKIVVHFDGKNHNQQLSIQYENKFSYPRYCHVDDKNISDSNNYLNCTLGNKNIKPVGLLWGDSYAGHLDPFTNYLLNNKFSFISRNASLCFPSLRANTMLGSPYTKEYCSLIRQQVKNELQNNKYKIVFIAARFDLAKKTYGEEAITSIKEAITFSSQHSELVFVFSQPITYKKPVIKTFLRTQISSIYSNHVMRDDVKTISLNKEIETFIKNSKFKNVYFIKRKYLYGNENGVDFTKSGIPYSYDLGHLNEQGSIEFAKTFKETNEYMLLMNVLNK